MDCHAAHLDTLTETTLRPHVCAGCSRGLGEHEPHFWRNHEARCSRCWDRLMAEQNEATIRRLERSIAERGR